MVLLDTSFELGSIIPTLLYLMGLWAVFCKSGVKGWWALIPCARQYKLGLCAGREPEGRMLAVMDFLMVATSLPGLYLQLDSATEMFLALVGLIAALIDIIYQIRVYNGLSEVYGRRKGWVVLWLLLGLHPRAAVGIPQGLSAPVEGGGYQKRGRQLFLRKKGGRAGQGPDGQPGGAVRPGVFQKKISSAGYSYVHSARAYGAAAGRQRRG